MTKNEELLVSVQDDIRIYGDYLQDIAKTLIEEKITNCPIFVAHNEEAIQLGKPVIDGKKSQTAWSINASMLEDFVNHQLFDEPQRLNFMEIYKDPTKFACVFLLTEKFCSFVFCPYEEEDEEEASEVPTTTLN